jgi:Flp pilus assembly protein TadG
MLLRIDRLLRREDGQAMVEMALILPLVVLLLFGIVEFGRGLGIYLTLVHATREGVRSGSLGADDTEIERTVKSCASGLDPNLVVVEIDPAEVLRVSGASVTVRVQYSFAVMVPAISRYTGAIMPMSMALSMRIE